MKIMHKSHQRGALAILIILLLSGCSTTPKVELQPIENRMPPNPPGVYDVSKVTVPPPKVELQPVENRMPPNAPGVYDVSKVTVRPVPTFQARPRYPTELRKAGLGGEGVTLFTVATDGTVKDAMIVRATDGRFGQAALEAVLKWKFRPAQLKGTVVDCRMLVPIVFTLNED